MSTLKLIEYTHPAMLLMDVGFAEEIHNKRWKITAFNGAPWESDWIQGRKTNVLFVESKDEARRTLQWLAQNGTEND